MKSSEFCAISDTKLWHIQFYIRQFYSNN